MKKNFKLKAQILKKHGYVYLDGTYPDFYNRKINRSIDAQAVNIMTLEQLSKFLGY